MVLFTEPSWVFPVQQASYDCVFHQLQQAQHHCWQSTWHWTHHPNTKQQSTLQHFWLLNLHFTVDTICSVSSIDNWWTVITGEGTNLVSYNYRLRKCNLAWCRWICSTLDGHSQLDPCSDCRSTAAGDRRPHRHRSAIHVSPSRCWRDTTSAQSSTSEAVCTRSRSDMAHQTTGHRHLPSHQPPVQHVLAVVCSVKYQRSSVH